MNGRHKGKIKKMLYRLIIRGILLVLLLLLMPKPIINASKIKEAWDKSAFLRLNDAERYAFVHQFKFDGHDEAQKAQVLDEMLSAAKKKKDIHASLVVGYRLAVATREATFEPVNGMDEVALYDEMHRLAARHGFEEERVIARYGSSLKRYYNEEITAYTFYIEILDIYKEFENIGFERFKDYDIAFCLVELGRFLWSIGDYERAVDYFLNAERLATLTPLSPHAFTQLNSYLQTYYKRREALETSIQYTKKNFEFHQKRDYKDKDKADWSQYWLYFSAIELADLYSKMGNYDTAFEYIQSSTIVQLDASSFLSQSDIRQAKFDLVVSLIPVQIAIGKTEGIDQHKAMIDTLLPRLPGDELAQQRNHIKYFQALTAYQNHVGQPQKALTALQKADSLQKALNLATADFSLGKVQQQWLTEQHQANIRNIESRRQAQFILNIALSLFLLTSIGFAVILYRKTQQIRIEKEKSLAEAKQSLHLLTISYKDKSIQVEKLKAANEKLIEEGKSSEYLNQLTSTSILTEEDWNSYKDLFERVHPGFIDQQMKATPDLTKSELRYLVLEKLGLSPDEMANMLGVNRNTIYQTRRRLKSKLD